MRLFDISQEFAEVFDALDGANEEEVADLIAVLADIQEEFDIKAESVALYIKELKAQANAIKDEEKNLKARRESKEKKAEYLCKYLKSCMEATQKSKVETPKCRITLRLSPESVEIDDKEALLSRLRFAGRTDLLRFAEPELNKTKIKECLQSGEQIDGARLVRGNSLIIK